jgi:RHS repeat-associated protein
VTSEVDKEGTASFTYDSGGEVTGVTGSRSESYGYDSGGNRNTSGYTTGTGNEMTSGGGYTFAYDSEGNVTGKTQVSTGINWAYSYDYRNRMTVATEKNSGGTTIGQATFTYDPENRRIGTDINGTQTWTVFDGVNPYADFNSSGALQDRYLYGPAVDEILARMDSSNNVAWYLPDRLGTIRDVVNTTGTVLDHVIYDSFGNVTSETNATNGDRFKFTGREFDAATGLYFYRARYYDPATGRFVEQDPLSFGGGDSNLYRYCGNEPTGYLDPTGDADMPAPTFPPQGGFRRLPEDPRPLPPVWTPVPHSEDSGGDPTHYTSRDPRGPGGRGPSAHWDGNPQRPHWDINYPGGSPKRTILPGGKEIDPSERHGPRNQDQAPQSTPDPRWWELYGHYVNPFSTPTPDMDWWDTSLRLGKGAAGVTLVVCSAGIYLSLPLPKYVPEWVLVQ